MMRWTLVVFSLALAPAGSNGRTAPARTAPARTAPTKTASTPAARPSAPVARPGVRTVPQTRASRPVAKPQASLVPGKIGRKPVRVGRPGRDRTAVSFTPCTSSLPTEAATPDDGMEGLVAERSWLWPNGATLNVHFLDGTPAARRAVAEVAREWTEHANLTFAFFEPDDPPPTTHVLVTFDHHACSSALGTSSQMMIARGDVSMTLCHMDTRIGTDVFQRIVLHEFGHAIGMHHEHQSPNAKFDWDKPFVYQYYRDLAGWNQHDVDMWVFRQVNPSLVNASEYDPLSVMQYSFPPEFTKNRQGIEGSHQLSPTDKAFAAKVYPKGGTPKPTQEKFFERRLAIRNDTGEAVDVHFAVQTKKNGKWVWAPNLDPEQGPKVRLQPGQQRTLPGNPTGRRVRFVARSVDAKRKWSRHQKSSLITSPTAGYLDRELQTFVVSVDGPPDATTLSRDELYASASNAYKKGDRELARGRFREFAQRFPKDPLTPWAQLNIAISYVEDVKYKDALLTSYELIMASPDSDASGYAWFYGGLSSLHLGKCTDARAYFDYVSQPTAGLPGEWQRAAREYLDAMKAHPKAWCG